MIRSIVANFKELSKGEEAFMLHCRAEKLTPEREFKFHPERRWRFDFAFPDRNLAVEVEGIGRHQTIGGFKKDAEKYNAAALLGWMVLRYTTDMVISGRAIDDVLAALAHPLQLKA
jgi:very-short-patch-repair endonuclease